MVLRILGRAGINSEILEPTGDLVLGAGEVGSGSEASPMIPPTTTSAIPMPTRTIATIISAAPSPRGTRCAVQPGHQRRGDGGDDPRRQHAGARSPR